jgi:DNA invertase Pin-like site-specific DNA recombinase
MGNFTINALSSQGSQRSLDKAGRVLENSELHCSALLTSCSRLLKLTLSHLIETVNLIETKGASLRSITEGIDTSTIGGRLTYNIFGSLAEFERDLVKERTMAGLAAARARGRIGGQPPKIDPDKARHIRRMLADGTPKTEIASVLGIGRATLYRHLTSTASRDE